MGAKKFIKSFFKKYTEQDVPVEMDLWPAIMSRFQNSGKEVPNEPSDAGCSGNPKPFVDSVPDVIRKSNNLISPKHKEFAMEKEKQGGGGPLTRQGFLKVTGATAAAAAVVGAGRRPVLHSLEEISSEAKSAAATEQIFSGVCRPNCFAYCALNVHVRDGKVVKTSRRDYPDPRYNRICLRGLSHVQRTYNPDRVKYPMKRAGARGEDKWERISWDEAITTITDQWKSIQESYGKQAVSFFSCSGSITLYQGMLPGITARLQNLIQATSISADVDAALAAGLGRTIGGTLLSQESDASNAKTMIAWGCNVTEAMPQTWHFYADAIEAGTKLVVIDPVFSIIASKAHEFIQVRPGSDPALILSLMQVIISEKLHKVDFLLAHTVAPFLVREDTKLFLRMSDLGVAPTEGPAGADGKPTMIDPVAVWDPAMLTAVPAGSIETPALEGSHVAMGINVRTAFDFLKEEVDQYPPEVASKLTEVDPETIRHLARICADTPVYHLMGFGPQAYDNGVHAAHAMGALVAITGNIGYPGATVGCDWSFYPGTNFVFSFPNFVFGGSMSNLAYRQVVETGLFQGKPFPIKAMYVYSGNPANTSVNTKEWVGKVLPTMDLVVVADSVFTDTARNADIVLPVCDWFEEEEIINSGQSHLIQWNEKAIEPLYESKPDSEIVRMLAEKMGVSEFFTKSDHEMMAEALDTPYSKAYGISVESLMEKKAIRYFPDPYIAYEGNIFPTASGRIEFYVEKPAPRLPTNSTADLDRERLPRFFPPTEAWPDNPLYTKYPLVLLSERPKFRVHSQWFATPWLRELDPEPSVKINAKDAAARNIKKGDYVEVFNDRGHAVVKAVVTQGVRPGVMVFAKGWQRKQYKAGDLSELTSSHFDPVGVNESFMDELAEVRKWNGEV
jgi:anaerobic selenocysteine-containing dehydrogenase